MKKVLYLLMTISLLTSCSKDDDNTNKTESITATINGTKKVYSQTGQGINLEGNSYRLDLDFMAPSEGVGNELLVITTRYKKTGKNKIEDIYLITGSVAYHETEDLKSNITVNNRKQFTASFSGTFKSEEGQTVTITEGYINTIYNSPFESAWGAAN